MANHSTVAGDCLFSEAWRTLATVFCQICQEIVHGLVRGAVHQVAPVALLAHQASMGQLFEVKRQGVGGYSQLLGDCARGETILACHDECAEDTEAYLLSKRCKRADNFRLIHFS